MRLFYNPEFDPQNPKLTEEELKHALRVLRLSEGDEIQIIDGKGNRARCSIISVSKKTCELKLEETVIEPDQFSYHLHIAIAPTKNIDRFEWFLEKATEIGITEITPIWCERSERKQIKPDRLEKILISAMKQSLKAKLPILHPAMAINEFVAQSNESEKFIAHCEPDTKQHLKEAYNGSEAVILIGPEGDFTQSEIQFATSNNFTPISLGESRLRTETAALVANQIINIHHA